MNKKITLAIIINVLILFTLLLGINTSRKWFVSLVGKYFAARSIKLSKGPKKLDKHEIEEGISDLNALACKYYQMGKLSEAEKYFKEALEKEKNQSARLRITFMLADIALDLGEKDKAREYLENIKVSKKFSENNYLDYAKLNIHLGNFASAIQYLELIKVKFGGSDILYELYAQYYRFQTQDEEGVAFFSEILSENDYGALTPLTLFLYSEMCMSVGKYDDAKESVTAALLKDPENAQSKNLLYEIEKSHKTKGN